MPTTDTLRVRPVEGRSLPLETAPRRRVDRPMQVPNAEYYRRAIARGDIELDGPVELETT